MAKGLLNRFKRMGDWLSREGSMFVKSPTKWLRKRNKVLLAVFGTLIMVAFLVPSVATQSANRARANPVQGQFINSAGEKVEFKLNRLRQSERNLMILQNMNLDQISSILSDPRVQASLQEFPLIGQFPNFMVQMLFFDTQGSMGNRKMIRNEFRMIAQNWVEEEEEREKVYQYIDELVASEGSKAPLYYLLLTEEARRNGFYATDEQIEKLIAIRQDLMAQGNLRGIGIPDILNSFGLSENEFRSIIGEYISVLTYSHVSTRKMLLSEQELKNRIYRKLGKETVSGTFVSFDAGRLFLDDVPEPTAEQLQAHFETYKSNTAGNVTEDNPHGFGYMLPNRVQVEYLRVDLEALRAKEKEAFEAMSRVEQEETLQEFWRNNRHLFREPLPENEENPEQPQFRDPPFDEIYGQVKTAWISRQARDKAEQVLVTSARRQIQAARAAGPDQLVDYARLADELDTEQVDVAYGKTNFFSRERGPEGLRFAETYKMRDRQPTQSLMEILFESEPFQTGPAVNLDSPPVKLHEDILSLKTLGYSDADAAYIMRLVAIDPEREALSLADDGRQGDAETEALETSQLRERVENDWKRKQAYDMALAHAADFREEAKGNWETAVEQTNNALTDDPNQPSYLRPLRENQLETVRMRMQRMRQQMQQNPNMARAFQQQIANNDRMLGQVVERVQELDAQQLAGHPIVELPAEFRCLVFKDLSIEPPTVEQYLQEKPNMANAIIDSRQGLLALLHFNPDNIIKRNGYVSLRELEGGEKQTP